MTITNAVESLEQRIAALEGGAKYDATKEEIRRVETEFLQKLKAIRAQVVAEQQGRGGLTSNAADTAELVRLRDENAKLKLQNEKLSYRVKHVVTNLNMLLDEKNRQQASE